MEVKRPAHSELTSGVGLLGLGRLHKGPGSSKPHVSPCELSAEPAFFQTL